MRKLNINDYAGKKYGRLTIKSIYISNNRTYCVARCECGIEKKYVLSSLKSGLTKSCGCIRKDRNNGSKYNYNEDFFDTLTEESAYVIGLIYTDGSLSKNNKRFVISLQESDKQILENIGMLIRNSKDVKFYTRKLKNGKIISGYYLSCNNTKLCNGLIKYGVYSNKTNTIVPSILLVNNRHFWRGCIDGDGDGGVSMVKNKYLRLDFGGTEGMVNGFIKFINQYISKYRYIKNLYHRIFICGIIIYHILYDNSTISINRKSKYMEYGINEKIISFINFNI